MWRGRLAPAGAAVAVAVAILTVSVVTRLGSAPSGPAPVASAPVTTEPPRPPTAVGQIEALAQLAAGPAAPVPTSGQVIRATDRYRQDGTWHTDTYHVDPQGLIVLDNSEFGGRGSFKQPSHSGRRRWWPAEGA